MDSGKVHVLGNSGLRARQPATRRYLKGWGLGCLALAVLGFLVLAGLGGWLAFEMNRKPIPRSIDQTQTLPETPGRLVPDVNGIAPTVAPGPATGRSA